MGGVTRRGFVEGALAFAGISGGRLPATAAAVEKPALPAYYDDCLATVAAKVALHASTCADGFWFITDPHVGSNCGKSGLLLAELGRRTGLAKVLCGGDLTEAFKGRHASCQAGVDFAVETYNKLWRDPVEAAGLQLYNAKGNHDFTIRLDPTADDGFTYSDLDARARVMGTKACREVVTNGDDPAACYYYFDNAGAKIRYIVADTTDSVDPARTWWAVVSGMHETQLRWLAEKAIATIPTGWSAVVMHHIPLTTCVGSMGERNLYAPFRRLLEAYQNRETVAVAGRTYDFTQAKGRILLDITGHHHAERQTFQRGILHVTEPCDAAYGDYIYGSPKCGELPPKKAGTSTEQTFDAVQLDPAHDRIFFTRVGGGQDRIVHLTPRTVKVGETIAFASACGLQGTLTWDCYDADRTVSRPNPRNKYSPLVDYVQTRGSIDARGVFAGMKPGEMLVQVSDGMRTKEIFPVIVV